MTYRDGNAAALNYGFLGDAADQAARAEDEAWTRFASMPLATPEEVQAWTAYVIEHAADGDEAVTLRRAFEHVAGLLVGRLQA